MPVPCGNPAKPMVFQLSRDLRDTLTPGLPVAWTRKKGDAGKGRALTRSNWQSGEPRWLLAGVSLGGADAAAQVPTNFAVRITFRDVVEISRVLRGIGQLVVHHGELSQGRLL
jgi:hypothetical protein